MGGKRKARGSRERDDHDDEVEEEVDAELARDFVMARLGAARAHAAAAVDGIDVALAYFVDPSTDPKGKEREEVIDGVDTALGNAAIAVQAAQSALDDIDPEAGE